MSDFYKDWNRSLSINNDGDLPFSRLVDLTPKEREQACKNLNIASNDAIVRLEGEFIDLRGDMATVSSDVASAVANANSALTAATAATTAAQAAIDSITGYATDLATVSSKADTNSGNIGTLSSDVSTLSANVGTISGKNTSQDTKIGELSSSVAGLTNSAVYHDAVINNLTTAWTAYSADLKNDFDTFSAAEDAVITAATAAIPGQVSAEVSGQLSGKQDKLIPGVNITLTTAGEIDVKKGGTCVASNGSVAIGYSTSASGVYALSHGESTYAGAQAHAEGYASSAITNRSHAEGQYTITDTIGQHVEGQYNAPATGALHVIGNGNSSANRSNIVETYTDRVVVNGDLINDTLSNFMFDNSQIATGTKTCVLKLDTNDWYCSTTAYTDYNKKYGNIFSGENFNINRSSGYQYPATIVCGLRKTNNYPLGIVEWNGDISKICWNSPSTAGNKNYVSSWPAQLPDITYISTFERMWSENSYVLGPDTVPTDLLAKTSATSVAVPRIFQDCPRISGNWDAYVSTWSAKPTTGKINCFRGCTGIDNYATYTANSALSSMFLG